MIKSLLYQILAGIHYLHSNWILHRDLKPSNVILCWSPYTIGKLIAKVADFGCSRLPETRPTLSVGFCTAWYRAPDVFEAVGFADQAAVPLAVDTAGQAGRSSPPTATVGGAGPQQSTQQPKSPSRYDFASDVWSLGCIYAEFLHGKILFETTGSFELGILGTIAARIGPPPPAVLAVEGWPASRLSSAGNVRNLAHMCTV